MLPTNLSTLAEASEGTKTRVLMHHQRRLSSIKDAAAARRAFEMEQQSFSKRKRLKDPKPWYILLPDHPLVTNRDLLSLVALVVLYFVLPFEIAFVDSPDLPDPFDPLFIFNRTVDAIFLVDIVLQFVVALPVSPLDDEGGSLESVSTEDVTGRVGAAISQANRYDYRLWRIALAYARGWLLLDVSAMVPSGFDVYFSILGHSARLQDGTMNGGEMQGESMAGIRATRTVKLVRLVRIARMLKMLRMLRLVKGLGVLRRLLETDNIVRRQYENMTVALVEHMRKVRIARLLLFILLACHMMACVLGVSALNADQKLDSWWGAHGYCWPDDLYTRGPGEEPKARCVDAWAQYFVCFHLTLSAIFKVPYDPFVLNGPGEVPKVVANVAGGSKF